MWIAALFCDEWSGRPTSRLRSCERNVAFGAKDIGIEIGNPLPAVRRDVEIANGGLNVGRHAVPVELRIFVDDVGGALVAELAGEARLLSLLFKGLWPAGGNADSAVA